MLFLVGGGETVLDPTSATAQDSVVARAADTTRHPDRQPYATDRSLAYHVLALPAYLLHGATRPIGWGMNAVERRYPTLFDVGLPPRGVLPLLDLGGPTGFMAGVVAYDNHLFGSDQEARVEGMYGSREAFRVRGEYEYPNVLGRTTEARLAAHFFSNPRDLFFVGGNAGDREADRVLFRREQFDGAVGLRYGTRFVTGTADLLYEHAVVGNVRGAPGEQVEATRPAARRTSDLLTPRLSLLLERTRGRPRIRTGTALLLQLDYTHDLRADRFRYGRYVAELRQYLPVGLFPTSRRLVLRARLEQARPLLGGTHIPFYQLPGLGGQSTLRGVRPRRFQDRGSLLVNAEYRYPIWSTLDAVVFVDAGQVFPSLGDVTLERFHWSYGGGVHLLNRRGLSVRFEVGGSTEGARAILTVEPAFRREPR